MTGRSLTGFTLIELIVVIAIIAVVTAESALSIDRIIDDGNVASGTFVNFPPTDYIKVLNPDVFGAPVN